MLPQLARRALPEHMPLLAPALATIALEDRIQMTRLELAQLALLAPIQAMLLPLALAAVPATIRRPTLIHALAAQEASGPDLQALLATAAWPEAILGQHPLVAQTAVLDSTPALVNPHAPRAALARTRRLDGATATTAPPESGLV